MNWLYGTDAADNLLPSIHCFVSWMCFIGVRNSPKVPSWWKEASFAIAIAICVSTLTTKQHILIDVFSGVLLAEICYALADKFPVLIKLPVIWKHTTKGPCHMARTLFVPYFTGLVRLRINTACVSASVDSCMNSCRWFAKLERAANQRWMLRNVRRKRRWKW